MPDIMSIYIHLVYGTTSTPKLQHLNLASDAGQIRASRQTGHALIFRQLSCKKDYKEREPSPSLSAGRDVFWTLDYAVDANIRHTKPVQIAIAEPVAHRPSPSRQTQDLRVLRKRCAIRED